MDTPVQNGPRRDPFTLALLVACLVLSGLVVVLAWQNWTMKRSLARLHAGEAPEGLAAGDVVTPFEIVDADGISSRVEFGEGAPRTLLLVFSSTCPACQRNLPIWKELLSRPLPDSLRVVGIQTDAVDGTSTDPSLPFPTFRVDRSRGAPLDRIPYVPATVVLDPLGNVVAAWSGVLARGDQADLARALDLPASAG